MKDVRRNIIIGYKPIVIKYLALLIGVCYLANPLHKQISGIFHEISHIFEAPDTYIGHSTSGEAEHIAHHYHEHAHTATQHEHVFIDILDSIFDASPDSNQEESSIVDLKVDKHINTDEYHLHKIYPIEKNFNFVSKENNLINPHLLILKEPPQILVALVCQ